MELFSWAVLFSSIIIGISVIVVVIRKIDLSTYSSIPSDKKTSSEQNSNVTSRERGKVNILIILTDKKIKKVDDMSKTSIVFKKYQKK